MHVESIVEHEYLCNVNELDRQIASSYHGFISVYHIVEWPTGQEYVRFMLNLLTCVYIVETLSQNVQNYERVYILKFYSVTSSYELIMSTSVGTYLLNRRVVAVL